MTSLVNKLPVNDDSVLLIPQNVNQTFFDGFIIVKNEEYHLQVHLNSPDALKNARIYCEWKLKDLIGGYEDVLQKRLHQSSSLQSFIDELKALIENLTSFREKSSSTTIHCCTVIKQIETIGWDRLMYCNEDFTVIKLKASDIKDRQHVLTVKLNFKHSSLIYKCITDLPVQFQPKYQQQDEALKLLYEQFLQAIDKYQLFWDAVDDIDKQCWVLEPEHKTYSCTYRRIALGKSSSIHIQLNPMQPYGFPECRLLGAEHVIEPLKQALNENINCWNNRKSILENLKELLSVEFPSPATSSKDEVTVECGICYSYRLLDEVPEQNCTDPRCGQTFHNSCLIEWLRSLPSCRQSFNVIFGECPYCNKMLTVKLGKIVKR